MCKTCGKRFSLRKQTPLFGLKMDDDTFYRIVKCLGEGNGIRKTARIMDVKPDTVMTVVRRMADHVNRIMKHFVHDLWPNEVQMDELWTFIHKKEGNLSELEALEREWGDAWVWVAFDPETKVILGFVVGKRTKDNAIRLLNRVKEVLGEGCLPLFTSDELASYEDALVQVFGVTVQPERKGTRGRFPNPIKVHHPKLNYAVVHKERKRNSIVKVDRRIVTGSEEAVNSALSASKVSTKVNTSFIERVNGTLRACNGRLIRKSLGFSQDGDMLRDSLCVTIGYNHLCRSHKGLRLEVKLRPNDRRWIQRSPVMALGKTDHVWSVREMVLFRVPERNGGHQFGACQ